MSYITFMVMERDALEWNSVQILTDNTQGTKCNESTDIYSCM